MKPKERAALRKKIEEAIIETEKRIEELENSTAPVGPENAIGRVSRMDAINNKSVGEAALRTARSKLGKLKIAMTMVEKETFGTCADCKQPIQLARLMFLPESDKCVRCASR